MTNTVYEQLAMATDKVMRMSAQRIIFKSTLQDFATKHAGLFDMGKKDAERRYIGGDEDTLREIAAKIKKLAEADPSLDNVTSAAQEDAKELYRTSRDLVDAYLTPSRSK